MAWTLAKRMSVQAYTLGLLRPPSDGAIDVGDRATVTWLFASDSYPSPPVPPTPTYTAQATTRRITHGATQATRLYWTCGALRLRVSWT